MNHKTTIHPHRKSLTLLLALTTTALTTAPPLAANAADICPSLQQQTQIFSDAGQSGNAAVLGKLLDPDVVFVNETGEPATRHDMVSGASPPPKGVSVVMHVTDWHCIDHGTVAVASFIDDQAVAGRAQHTQFRSVETWLQHGATWRIIGSETLTLPIDPPAITLSSAALSAYAGTYTATSGLTVVFTQSPGGLLASVNAGPPSVQKAEIADVFFTPGHGDVRKIFQRNKTGAVTGFLYVHGGNDIAFRRQ